MEEYSECLKVSKSIKSTGQEKTHQAQPIYKMDNQQGFTF